jgi:hypothetical protein
MNMLVVDLLERDIDEPPGSKSEEPVGAITSFLKRPRQWYHMLPHLISNAESQL